MNSFFSFSKFAGVAAAAVWTLGWLLIASLAAEHLAASGDGVALFNLMVTLAGIVFGGWMTIRFYPRTPGFKTENPSPPEPWYRRALGWFGAIVWSVVAVIWNMAIFGILVQSATKGQSLNFVILIPFSLIGLFLLLFPFTGIALVMDSLFQLGDVTPSSVPAESAVQPLVSLLPKTNEPAAEFPFKKSPILGTLALLSFVNWFVFAGISIYLGGDAVGILPSHDGFVVKSHGHRTSVSESAWVFSLFYSSATLLLTPLIWLLFAARQFGGRSKEAKWPLKLFIGVFLLVWFVGWYSSIGGSFRHSLEDWQKLKQHGNAVEPLRQSPDTAADLKH